MKNTFTVFVFLACISFNSFAVNESELQDIADCMAAVGITNVTMQMNGDYKNYKLGEKISSRLMDIFYDKLFELKKIKPSIDEAYLGQMPNRASAQYSRMNELQQMKYAKSVMDTNNCFQYIR
jgi:hypothetical protein